MIDILGSDSGARDRESAHGAFHYDSYHVIAKFFKNREVVFWCTKLMRSDADGRVNTEVAMREKGLRWILCELAGDRQAAAAKSVEEVDVDEPQQLRIPKTGTITAGWTGRTDPSSESGVVYPELLADSEVKEDIVSDDL